MLAIGNYSWLVILLLALFSIVPVISFFGKIFTRYGRDTFLANPLLFIYFVTFGVYAYFFWTSPILIYDYVGLNGIYQKLLYAALCMVPFFERDIPN